MPGKISNGVLRQTIYGLIAAAFLGLSGWTLMSVRNLAISIARVEQDEVWIIRILTEQSKKFKPEQD